MDQKTIGWVSYLTLIGWIIALISYNGSNDKSALAKFHLRQSLGIMLTGIIIYIVLIMFIFSFLWIGIFFIWAIEIALFVFWLLGLISAVNGEMKPVPVLGELYQKTLTFIN